MMLWWVMFILIAVHEVESCGRIIIEILASSLRLTRVCVALITLMFFASIWVVPVRGILKHRTPQYTRYSVSTYFTAHRRYINKLRKKTKPKQDSRIRSQNQTGLIDWLSYSVAIIKSTLSCPCHQYQAQVTTSKVLFSIKNEQANKNRRKQSKYDTVVQQLIDI